MNVCEAMNAYANKLDWASYLLFFILGCWKLSEISAAIYRWAVNKPMPKDVGNYIFFIMCSLALMILATFIGVIVLVFR